MATLAALLAGASIGWALPWRLHPHPPGFASRLGDPARGARVFNWYCQHCHGEGGHGGGCPDLGGLRDVDAAFLTVWITGPRMINPTSPMPRIDTLRPPDVEDLVAYLKTLHQAGGRAGGKAPP